jgi:hypothetical protein
MAKVRRWADVAAFKVAGNLDVGDEEEVEHSAVNAGDFVSGRSARKTRLWRPGVPDCPTLTPAGTVIDRPDGKLKTPSTAISRSRAAVLPYRLAAPDANEAVSIQSYREFFGYSAPRVGAGAWRGLPPQTGEWRLTTRLPGMMAVPV